MLINLIGALIADVHAIVSHQSTGTVVADSATTVEDVLSLVPGSIASDAALVAAAVNAVLGIAKAAIPAANTAATAAISDAQTIASAVASPLITTTASNAATS